jgi:hypothetical protein
MLYLLTFHKELTMKADISKFALYTMFIVAGLSTSLVLHGFIVHKLTPIETFECAAEEIGTSLKVGSNLFTTKCDLIK